ncbi:protein FLUORESCENT IN BLUE LIGHT, chloroplastic-like isoform X2 [Solanum dulcamara]|uniref:protein FLUORESCENT IN BLUE LIGHT, chloroplastic-like isoform X2 n=1 Tax=Solanum dulcamara TaxID=45834 RepID=UPI002485EEEE|nr:protein FLUORESCENT IN BLUE LIGHT, chloroplastic-like isoform X2 [Solanum dulcamara]
MTMMVKQWLLSQTHFLSDPFKSAPVKCILLESGHISSKWGEVLPQKLFHKRTKNGSKCIHIDFKFRYPAAALIVTNALMMTTPLDALAQTCEADTTVFNMPLLLLVALIGATVGGLVARQRKAELQRLNEQLRQINTALRRQAKIESYAPTLSYAPVGGKISESEVIIDPKKEELISHLKTGKIFLRNQALEKAFLEFKIALELARDVKDPIEEKKAARGLGASLQRQGKYKEAIECHSMVLDISARNGEESGSTEAYGAIADCYTELGDIERAAKYYDQYIARLQSD